MKSEKKKKEKKTRKKLKKLKKTLKEKKDKKKEKERAILEEKLHVLKESLTSPGSRSSISRPIKICMLIRRHPFLDSRVFEKEAKSLARAGFDVTIVAGKRKGSLLHIDRSRIKSDKYKKDHFTHEGIHFSTYEAVIPTGKKRNEMIHNMFKDIRNNRQTYFIDDLAQTALNENADIYLAHEWEALYDAAQIKRFLKKFNRNVKIVYDAHELEDDMPLMKELAKEVDYMTTVSKGLQKIYTKRYGIPVDIIYNSAPLAAVSPYNKKPYPFVIAHEGALTPEKGNPEKIQEIIRLCKGQMQLSFKIIGGTTALPRYVEIANQMKKNPAIIWRGWVSYKNLPAEYKDVHLGYIDFSLNISNNIHAMPNKFFSYLNNGVPVIVNGANDMAEFIKENKCGVVINKKEASARDYANEIFKLYKDRKRLEELSSNARKAMEKTYCWERMEEKLESIFKKL